MSDILDLDALVPKSVVVKFGGDEITINPPKTGDVLRLGVLGQKLTKIEDLNEADVEAAVSEVTAHIGKIIPELNGKELNTSQLLALVKIISDMATPPDVKELDKRGITPDDPKAP